VFFNTYFSINTKEFSRFLFKVDSFEILKQNYLRANVSCPNKEDLKCKCLFLTTQQTTYFTNDIGCVKQRNSSACKLAFSSALTKLNQK